MILLDGIDKHDPPQPGKLVADSSSAPVARPHTPTPSLPDYEASQAQLKPTTQSFPEIQKQRTRRRRWKKCALYTLVVYFVVTVAIGVPLIVMKFKRKAASKSNPYSQAWSQSFDMTSKSVTLGDAPLRLSSAKSCNVWTSQDVLEDDGQSYRSDLDYRVPVNGSVFLNTNITYSDDTSYFEHFGGQLLVGVNTDSSVSEATVHVTMHHTTPQLRNATNVCLMQTGQGGGIYLFTPLNMTASDALHFNITLLLPRNSTISSTLVIPQLLCHLPNFQHVYQQMDPYVTFGSIILGGALSGVAIESIQASQAVVKGSSAEIQGKFTVDSSLSLETVSAPINADIRLFNNGTTGTPTYLHLTTGNHPLNATVSMFIPADMPYMDGPHFMAHAETFNAPLTVVMAHDPASAPAVLRMQALNNLGNTRLSVDSRFEGTFDVNTMFAQADVLAEQTPDTLASRSVNDRRDNGPARISSFDEDDDDDDDDGTVLDKVRMFIASTTTTSASSGSSSAANNSRCLEYDLISNSEIRGWVGTPPRPSPTSPAGMKAMNNMGHLEVVSSLSGAQLVLLT